MRKRSGALSSDSEENYIDIAIKCQKTGKLFESDISEELEEESPKERSRSYEYVDFEFNNENKNFFSKSYPPSNEIFTKTEKKENEASNETNVPFTIRNFEKDFIAKRLIKIMLVGEMSSGKKSLILNIFKKFALQNNTTNNMKTFGQNVCLDLILKTIKINKNEEITYKFWIQNLSNEKFDNIIKIYYKSIDIFAFVYEIGKKNSISILRKSFENIKNSIEQTKMKTVLIGMNLKNIDLKEFELEILEAEEFKSKNGIDLFFKVNLNEDNSDVLEKISSLYYSDLRFCQEEISVE